MALGLLLNGDRSLGIKRSGETGFAFELDLILSERHERRAEITNFPIEDGSPIADHVILQPERIELTGFITNTPVLILGGLSFEDRAQNALDVLNELHVGRSLVTVVSELQVYEDMVFSELIYPRDARTGEALEFRGTLQKINKVSSELVLIPNVTSNDQASPEQDVGTQSTTLEV